jgi:hypothetical protein
MTNVTALKTNPTKPAPRVPSVEEATHDLEQIEARIVENAHAIAECEARMGADYKSVAAGGEVAGSDDLGRLLGEQRALGSMQIRAQEALERAEARERARVAISNMAVLRQRLADRAELARQAEAGLEAAVQALAKLHYAGIEFVREMASMRGTRSMKTKHGTLGLATDSIAGGQNLQWLVEGYLTSRLSWWRSEQGGHLSGHLFAERVEGQGSGFANELEILMGIVDLNPEDVAAVEAERAA